MARRVLQCKPISISSTKGLKGCIFSRCSFATLYYDSSLESEVEGILSCRIKCGSIALNDAVKLFDRMRQTEPLDLTKCYVTVLSDIVKAERYSDAIELYRRLEANGITGNGSVLSILVNCYCCVGCSGYGFGVLGLILKRGYGLSSVCVASLVRRLCMEDKIAEAARLFHKAKEMNCCVDRYVYRTMIRGLCKVGNSGAAVKLNEAMADKTSDCRVGIHIDLICYNVMIEGLFKDGLIDMAGTLFAEMKNKRIFPDAVTYRSMINGLVNRGQLREVGCMLLEMKNRGFTLDTATFELMIHGLCQGGVLWEGLRCIFQEMLFQGVRPTIMMYHVLIEALLEAGKPVEAKGLLAQMIQTGVEPSLATYNSLLNGMVQNGMVRDVESLLRETRVLDLIPNEVTFDILVKAVRLLSTLKDRTPTLSTEVCNRLIHGLFQEGKNGIACGLLSRLLDEGFRPDAQTCSAIISEI